MRWEQKDDMKGQIQNSNPKQKVSQHWTEGWEGSVIYSCILGLMMKGEKTERGNRRIRERKSTHTNAVRRKRRQNYAHRQKLFETHDVLVLRSTRRTYSLCLWLCLTHTKTFTSNLFALKTNTAVTHLLPSNSNARLISRLENVEQVRM